MLGVNREVSAAHDGTFTEQLIQGGEADKRGDSDVIVERGDDQDVSAASRARERFDAQQLADFDVQQLRELITRPLGGTSTGCRSADTGRFSPARSGTPVRLARRTEPRLANRTAAERKGFAVMTPGNRRTL